MRRDKATGETSRRFWLRRSGLTSGKGKSPGGALHSKRCDRGTAVTDRHYRPGGRSEIQAKLSGPVPALGMTEKNDWQYRGDDRADDRDDPEYLGECFGEKVL